MCPPKSFGVRGAGFLDLPDLPLCVGFVLCVFFLISEVTVPARRWTLPTVAGSCLTHGLVMFLLSRPYLPVTLEQIHLSRLRLKNDSHSIGGVD